MSRTNQYVLESNSVDVKSVGEFVYDRGGHTAFDIAKALKWPLWRVNHALNDLEAHKVLTFNTKTALWEVLRKAPSLFGKSLVLLVQKLEAWE